MFFLLIVGFYGILMKGGMDNFRLGLILVMILSGSINTLNDKFQNRQRVTEGGNTKYFYHPYMQTTAVFIGQTMALPLYLLLRKRNPKEFQAREQAAQKQGKIMKFNRLRIAVGAICDVLASTMQCVALNFVAGSAYQMMRGGTVATTFVFTVLYLRRKATKPQLLGSIFTIGGVLLVGVAGLIGSSSGPDEAGLQVVGYLLLITSFFFNGFQFAYQQGIFEKYHIEPMQMVGIQGICGLTLNLTMVLAFTFTPCPFGTSACVFTDQGAFFQRPQVYFRELGDDHLLMGFCILYLFSVMAFNISGLSVTRYINGLARAVCDVARTLIIWIVGLIVTLTIGQSNTQYEWQKIDTSSLLIQSAGFCLIVLGNLVYNKLVRLPCIKQHEQEAALLSSNHNDSSS